jgi:hypothetical protein
VTNYPHTLKNAVCIKAQIMNLHELFCMFQQYINILRETLIQKIYKINISNSHIQWYVVICIEISSSEVFDPNGSRSYTTHPYMRHKYTLQGPVHGGAVG